MNSLLSMTSWTRNCTRLDKLIKLWTLNRQAKIVLGIVNNALLDLYFKFGTLKVRSKLSYIFHFSKVFNSLYNLLFNFWVGKTFSYWRKREQLISTNNSKSTNHRHTSLTGTDHCNSMLSQNFLFGKNTQVFQFLQKQPPEVFYKNKCS